MHDIGPGFKRENATVKSLKFGGPISKVTFVVLEETISFENQVIPKRLVVNLDPSSLVLYEEEARVAYDDLMTSGIATGPNPFNSIARGDGSTDGLNITPVSNPSSLTPAQRLALLWLPAFGGWAKFNPPGGFFVMVELEKAGLVRIAELGFALTFDGMLTRKELEKTDD